MRSLLIFGLFLVGIASSARANLLTNGSFEADNASADPFYLRAPDKPTGWLPVGDFADIIHNNYTQPPELPVLVDAQDGVQFLDLNQAATFGGVAQEVAAGIGNVYRLSLWSTAWAANGTGQIRYSLYDPLSLATLASATFNATEDGIWHELTLDAAAISNSIGVKIEATQVEQAGPGLDNVSLDALATPEPGTAALLAGAGLAALLLRRRNLKAGC